MVDRVARVLAGAGTPVESIPTTGPKTGAALARQCIGQGADLILVAGGDGTINEVINGAVHSDVAVGILPGGTANVLATELGICKGFDHAAKALCDSTPQRISLGLLRCAGEEPRYFAIMAGAGLDAHIVYHVSARMKSMLGKFWYWLAAFGRAVRLLPEFTVEIGGRQLRSSFALASRVRNYGGDLEIARSVTLLDHDFEVVLFAGRNPLRYLKYLSAVLLGKAEGRKGVTVLRADSLALSSPEDRRIYVQVDGEFAGRLPATIKIVPHCLTLLLPPDFSASAADRDRAWTRLPTR